MVAFLLLGFTFFVNLANAEENFNLPLELKIPGTINGEGTHFEITDSQYLNTTLDSSEPIKIRMESIPEMVTIMIEPLASSTHQTQITLSGFASSTKYYKYQDDYHNLTEFITDENGRYTYTQDLSKPHFLFIQPKTSTKFIKDDATGGDCASIGIWDASTKTCTLTTDLNETIQIDDSNLTIDGNGHFIQGNNIGIYIFNKNGVIIKNTNIKNSSIGIYFYSSSNNYLKNNTVFNNHIGVALSHSRDNNLFNNNISFNASRGFYLTGWDSINNNISSNFISDNQIGIDITGLASSTISNNTILNYVYGIYGECCVVGNKIFNNNILNGWLGIYIGFNSSGNIFNLPAPIGGNYWISFDEPSEGCDDFNNDKFCDSPRIFSGGQDNLPWTKQDGWRLNQPPTLSNLGQFKSDGITQISENGITTENTVIFKATATDPDNDQVKLQIELKEYNQSFDEQNLLESGFVNSGSEVVITKTNLSEGQYHWRARAVDDKGNASEWQEFGTAGNVDFEVKLPLSYKAANLAKELIYQPYLWGGKGWDYIQSEFVAPSTIKTGYNFWNKELNQGKGGVDFGAGVDCSGLIMWAYDRSFDPNKSRFNNFVKAEGADEQYRYNTTSTTEAELKPGDVMFFDFYPTSAPDGFIDHVAMYVGESGGYDVVSASDPIQGIVPRLKDDLKNLSRFRGFKQVVSALPPSVLVSAGSPVDLIVTDPDGFTITPTTIIPSELEFLREIPGVLYYSEMERGADGNPIDQVYSYTLKTGDYIIQVIPEPGTPPNATYTLKFSAGDQSITLAQDIPISQIPSEGYGITISVIGTLSTFIPVSIDIKPGSYPNSINLDSKGTIPVAVFGNNTFDVHRINLGSITFANVPIKLKKNGQPMASYEDVNEDGFTDLVIHVITKELNLTPNDTEAYLEGQLKDGTIIKGSDSVRIVPK